MSEYDAAVDAVIQDSEMWLSNTKPPIICKLVLEALGTLLQVPGEDISLYRVPAGSNYGPTVSRVANDAEACMAELQDVDVRSLENTAADILFTISDHPEWSLSAAEQEGNGIMILFEMINGLCKQLLETPGRKPIVSETFMVAIDGSRMAHNAFDVAASLRGHGKLMIHHIEDQEKSYLPSHHDPRYLKSHFESKCSEKLIPREKYEVVVRQKEEGVSTKHMLLHEAHLKANYLVLGAFGRKGPSIFKLGTVTDHSVRCSPLTTIIVKTDSTVPGMEPAPVGEFSAATSSAAATSSSGSAVQKPGGNGNQALFVPSSATFVVAVDHSSSAEEAVYTALRLMKPQDMLKILHIDVSSPKYTAADVVGKYQQVIEAALVDAEVVREDKRPGKTVAQQVCAFVSATSAHYLVMGIDGMTAFMSKGAPSMGSITDACVKNARCTVVICKDKKYYHN